MVKIIDKILKVFADNNLFNEGVELIGSWCFKLYEKHLAVKNFPLLTQDVDFLIPHPFRGKKHEEFISQLKALGFYLDFHSDGSLYLWNAELKIEFITPQKGRGVEMPVKIKKLGINAIPLRFVTLLLNDPITVVENGIKILVPNPANFCLHKLIIASRRKNIDKTLKDLQQAICTSVIVDKNDILKLFNSFPKKWKISISKMLDKAKQELILFYKEINDLMVTLQLSKDK